MPPRPSGVSQSWLQHSLSSTQDVPLPPHWIDAHPETEVIAVSLEEVHTAERSLAGKQLPLPYPSSHQKEQPGTTQASQLEALVHASPQLGPPELEPEPDPELVAELVPELDPGPDPDPEGTTEQSENAQLRHWPLAGPSELPCAHVPVSPHQPHPDPARVHSPHDEAPAQVVAASGATQPAETSSPTARAAPLPNRSLARVARREDVRGVAGPGECG